MTAELGMIFLAPFIAHSDHIAKVSIYPFVMPASILPATKLGLLWKKILNDCLTATSFAVSLRAMMSQHSSVWTESEYGVPNDLVTTFILIETFVRSNMAWNFFTLASLTIGTPLIGKVAPIHRISEAFYPG